MRKRSSGTNVAGARPVPIQYVGYFVVMGEESSLGENAEDATESAGEGKVPLSQ